MLVMSIREGERVVMTHDDGTESVVMVVAIRSQREIKLGFEAPASVKILRESLTSTSRGEVS